MRIKLSKKARRRVTAIVVALIVAWLVALWAIPAAYAERGYRAVGGEWLLITVAAGVVYSTLAHAPRESRKKEDYRWTSSSNKPEYTTMSAQGSIR